MEKQCTICKETKDIEEFNFTVKSKGYRSSRCKICESEYKKQWRKTENTKHRKHVRDWQIRNSKEYIKKQNMRKLRSKTLAHNIYFDLTVEKWEETLKEFNYQCPLTGSTDIVMDHFIPLDWNRGGTYIGNVYPLDRRLNELKHVKHPFLWLSDLDVDDEKKYFLINYLAKNNSLTEEEFISYVNWCDMSRDIKSVDIWRSIKR